MTRVLITGMSRGIGRAAALACAARGAELGLLGRPSERQRETAAACLKGGATRVLSLAADATRVDQLERAASEFLEAFGAPDAIIHSAGIAVRSSIEATSIASWQEQLQINLSAPFILTRALLPAMRARRTGRIVFVGSISSTLGTANLAGYCASKWGLIGLMKSLAAELTDSGLMTCAVLPGSVDTEMLVGSGFPPRMSPEAVAQTLVHYAFDAPLAHNGGSIEMFGT
ncbi:MAG TPA: SDR family oxidoreductase [Polyangiaceae bacterium]|nr:SDR family oxidoreductase [Polyangiaceae bacterium]